MRTCRSSCLFGVLGLSLLLVTGCGEGTPDARVTPPPAATDPGAVTTEEDQASVGFVLTGTSPDGLPLAVTVTERPSHGVLSAVTGAAPLTVVYTPAPDWFGSDSFAFAVTDSQGNASGPQTVSVTVTPTDDAPMATAMPRQDVVEDGAATLTLAGTDPDGHAVTLAISADPLHGTLTVSNESAPFSVEYLPAPDFTGEDSFSFTATDPTGRVSAPVEVALRVTPVNDAPVATELLSAATDEDVSAGLVLTGMDIDGDLDLDIEVTVLPAHGTLDTSAGAAPLTVRYTPQANYYGTDAFSFRVLDGSGASSAAVQVPLTIRPVNDAPTATPQQGLWIQAGEASGQLSGTDLEGDALSYELAAPPRYGTVTVDPSGSFVYSSAQPPCRDAFSFRARDASAQSAPAVVELRGGPPVITALEPPQASAGMPLRIKGYGFCETAGTISVTAPGGYGGYGAPSLWWSETEILTTLPGVYDSGPHDVLLYLPNGQSDRASLEVLPSLSAVSRYCYSSACLIDLQGTAFGTTQGTVTVDGAAANVTDWSPALVNATAAAGILPGVRSVGLTTADGLSPVRSTILVRGSDQWLVSSVAPPTRGPLASAWTGRELVVWDAMTGIGGRYNPGLNSWLPVTPVGAPTDASPQGPPTAVWTGKRVAVWGGSTNAGHLYDPTSDAWTAMATLNAPTARSGHSAVWTGAEMIVWGGIAGGSATHTGARYDPETQVWTSLSTTGAPQGRSGHVAVWTGTEMIVWGGTSATGAELDTGARYDPATNSWLPMSTTGAPTARTLATGVWTGKELVVWGGGSDAAGTNTGGRYDPAEDRWQPTATTGAPTARVKHTAVWTGRRMVVWGGESAAGASGTGGRYDPVSDSWQTTSAADEPKPRTGHVAVWTGVQMVVWGGRLDSREPTMSGGRYQPDANEWSPTAAGGAPAVRSRPYMVAASSDVLIWGGVAPDGTVLNDGAKYNTYFDRWSAMSSVGAPEPRTGATAVWAGYPVNEMILWGGLSGGAALDTGGRYHPGNDSWSATPVAGAPSPRHGHSALWTGEEMIIWGGSDAEGTLTNTGYRFKPSAQTWSAMSVAGAPTARVAATAVWVGGKACVWGGRDETGELNTGACYTPGSDTWAPISATNAPSARAEHVATVAGGDMIIWGGVQGTNVLDSGARLDLNGFWTAITPAPIARRGATGATLYTSGIGWELLVWGGDSGAGPSSAGAVYNLTSKAWTPTSAVRAPTARSGFASAWNGRELVIWGGTEAGGEICRYLLRAP